MIERLERHYSWCESLYVRTQKFVTVRQRSGEDYSSYLLRIEKLSHSLEFSNSENEAANNALQAARTSLAVVLAVNGLRDKALCRELISVKDLKWDTLRDLLRCDSNSEYCNLCRPTSYIAKVT